MTLLSRPAESEELRASEERLQLALRAGHSGVWDWDMARDAAEVSPSYRELFGLPPGSPVTYDVWLNAVHPEDRERCRAYGEAFFAGSDTDWRLEFRIVTPHMGVRWHRAIGRVYRDEAGKPLRFLGVTTDITEEQRTLAALRESEERFRAMADGLPLIIWVHDAEGSQQFVNRTFLEYFGVAEAEMKGEHWQVLACTRERRPFRHVGDDRVWLAVRRKSPVMHLGDPAQAGERLRAPDYRGMRLVPPADLRRIIIRARSPLPGAAHRCSRAAERVRGSRSSVHPF